MSHQNYFQRFLDYFAGLEKTIKTLDGFSKEILYREVYETIFGITDLKDAKQPLGLIRYTNADTLGDLGSIAEVVQEYRNNELKDKFGLSINEYFELPITVAKILISQAKTEKEDLNDIIDASEANAKKQFDKLR